LRADASGKLGIEPAFAADYAPKRRDHFLSRAPVFVGGFGSNPDKDSGTKRARDVYFAAPGQLFPELKHGNELSLGHAANQCIDIKRPGNDHAALSQTELHARRYVHDFRLLLAFKFFPPRDPAAEFSWHGARSAVHRIATDAILQQVASKNLTRTDSPTKLLAFGNPKAGTPLMLAASTVAIDLPLKLLAWEGPLGGRWISYNSPQYLQERHALPDDLLKNIVVIEAWRMRLQPKPQHYRKRDRITPGSLRALDALSANPSPGQ
jgi:hypothetical protein